MKASKVWGMYQPHFKWHAFVFCFVFTDKNLPNSSNVEVEVTPPMNGTAGQEGEAVRNQTHTHTLHIQTPTLCLSLSVTYTDSSSTSERQDLRLRESYD